MAEFLILVDEQDQEIGQMEKEKCHRLPGFLHRGFLVMVFNSKGELLLTRRSQDKPLFPEIWDGSIASHPRIGEGLEEAVKRRLVEEIGVNSPVGLENLFKFEYEACWKDKGVEKEVCSVFKVVCPQEIKPNPKEIDGFSWIPLEDLKKDLKNSPEKYSPWFKKAVEKLGARD